MAPQKFLNATIQAIYEDFYEEDPKMISHKGILNMAYHKGYAGEPLPKYILPKTPADAAYTAGKDRFAQTKQSIGI